MARALTNTDPVLRPCWHPVARSEEVTEQPHGVMLLGEPWVLYRSGGEVRAFADRCPHRHCPLTLGHCEGGVLQCAYHGWRFDGDGRCVEIPALGERATLPPAARLTPAGAVAEAHGIVFIAPEPPITPLGSVPEADDPAFMMGPLPTLRARGSAGLLADNFLDIAHFPFVHAGTFGTEEAAEVAPFAVARDDWSFTVSYEHPFAHREDPGVAAGLRPLVQTRRLTYRLSAPFHLRLRIDFVDSGGSNVIGFFIQPETDETLSPVHHPVAGRPRRRRDAHGRGGGVRGGGAARGPPDPGGLPRTGAPARPHRRGPHQGRPRHAGTAAGPGRSGGDRPGGSPVTAVTVVDHPVLAHRLAQLRDRHTSSDTFRQLISEVSGLLAYEALRDLGTDQVTVDTPVADAAPARRVAEVVLLVPILRAGLGMVQAIQEIVPLTEVAHVGLRRDDTTLRSEVYLNRLPRDLGGRRVIVCDPMLATGGSLGQVCGLVRDRGAAGIIALCIVASEPGLATFGADHPGVRVYCAAVDPDLNGTGFIVPGLGDAGDRLFGPPD